jgi:hypothetical protein
MTGSVTITCPKCGSAALCSTSKGVWCPHCKNGIPEVRREHCAFVKEGRGGRCIAPCHLNRTSKDCTGRDENSSERWDGREVQLREWLIRGKK